MRKIQLLRFLFCFDANSRAGERKASFSLFLAVFTVYAATAQHVNLLTKIQPDDLRSKTTSAMEKIGQLGNSGVYRQVTPVEVGSLPGIQKNGVLTLSSPDSKERYSFYAQSVNAESELDFKWYGVTKDRLSSAFFTSKKGQLAGAFNLDRRLTTASEVQLQISRQPIPTMPR